MTAKTTADAIERLREWRTEWPTDRVMVPYQLPDGEIVLVDDSAAKGAHVIDYTLKGGTIVQATRFEINTSAERAAGEYAREMWEPSDGNLKTLKAWFVAGARWRDKAIPRG